MTYQFISSERYTDTSTKLTFMLNGRQTIVVRPDKPANGNPTVWRTEFFGALTRLTVRCSSAAGL